MTSPDLTDPGTLLDLLRRHEFHTRKRLGQHFLVSKRALTAILSACAGDTPVLEIGPGPGTVTRPLADAGRHVTAVELDYEAVALLAETVGAFPNVRIVQGDILTLDLTTLLDDTRWTVVGNLPYYITTPVITRLLEHAEHFDRMVFLVQREVAERLAAAPGTPAYGSLSVHVQALATVKRVAIVPATAFMPPPTVQSAVVCLTMREEPLVPLALRETFTAVVRAAFGQRRKTLLNALAGNADVSPARDAIEETLRIADISPKVRGEQLGIPEFLRIAEAVSNPSDTRHPRPDTRHPSPEVLIVTGEAGCKLAVERRAIAVVVDALRASATLAALFDRGGEEVYVVATVEDARALGAQIPNALLVGERGGERLPGFDLGNSPCEVEKCPDLAGRTVIFTSSNGAQRLAACAGLPAVAGKAKAGAAATLVGSVTNATALLGEATRLSCEMDTPIVFIPAGKWPDEDFISPEDEATCTYLAALLGGRRSVGAPKTIPTENVDALCAALPAIFNASAHAVHLVEIGYGADVTACAMLDTHHSVPHVTGPVLLDGRVIGVRLTNAGPA